MGRRARPLGVSAICETVGNKRKLAVMSKLVSNTAAEPERFSTSRFDRSRCRIVCTMISDPTE